MPLQTEQTQMPRPPLQGSFRNPALALGEQASRRKPSGRAKALVLVVLAFLVVFLGGDVRQMAAGSARPTLQALEVRGPFIQRPLSPEQVSQLHLLSSYMDSKTLANMYLSRMTLDQKLGQLFMVQYWGYSYSADLETMIHNQYAGCL